MSDNSAALVRAARAAARLHLSDDDAVGTIVDAVLGATTQDAVNAIAATYGLRHDDPDEDEMRRLLILARDLGLFERR